MQRTEQGFVTVFVVVIILTMELLSGFFVFMADNERLTAINYFNGLRAQCMAEAGIQETFAKLSTDEKFVEMARMASPSGTLILRSQNFTDKAGFCVYISASVTEYVVLSIGNYDTAKRQVVAYLDFSAENQTFSIIRLDNQ